MTTIQVWRGEEYEVRRGHRLRGDQALPLPGLRPGDPSRDAAHGRLAGVPSSSPPRARRAPALAQPLLEGARPPPLTRRGGLPPLARAAVRPVRGPSPAPRRAARGAATNGDMAAIRANSVLPARREDIELHTADGLRWSASWRCRWTGSPVATADLPAPAAHPRRDDGQPRVPQGGLPAARAGRPRRAAVQHPGHVERAGHQRGRVRPRRGGAVRRRRRDRVRRVPRPAGHLAGRLVVRHRPGPDARLRPGGAGRDPALPAAALLRRRRTSRLGRVRQAADRAGAGVRRLPAAARGRASGSRRSRRPRSSGRRAPSTCGSATPRRCSTRSSARVAPEVAVPLPRDWDGPMETARRQRLRRPHRGRVQGRARARTAMRTQNERTPDRVGSVQRASCRGRNTSRTISWIAAAVGIASSAPTTPSRPAPTSAATTISEPGMSTERAITRG